MNEEDPWGHVSYATFGLKRKDEDPEPPSPVEEVLRMVSGGLDSRTAQLLLRETYETMYQICNHDDEGVKQFRPLALVAMHPKENTADYSKLYRTVVRYKDHKVNELFGLNLTEFLDLPHELVELIFTISLKHVKAQSGDVDKAMRELEKSGR